MFLELTDSVELARVEEKISKRGWAKSLKNRRKHVLILRKSKSRRTFLLNFVKKLNLKDNVQLNQ